MFLTKDVLYKTTTINVQSPDWLTLLSFLRILCKVKVAGVLQRTIKIFNKTRSFNKYIIITYKIRFFRFQKSYDIQLFAYAFLSTL